MPCLTKRKMTWNKDDPKTSLNLKRMHRETAERRKRLEALRGIQEEIKTQQFRVGEKQSELVCTLQGMSLAELQNSVNEKRTEANTQALIRTIVENASELLQRGEEDPMSCPVCETTRSKQDLKEVLQQTIDKLSDTAPSTLDKLESQLEQSRKLDP